VKGYYYKLAEFHPTTIKRCKHVLSIVIRDGQLLDIIRRRFIYKLSDNNATFINIVICKTLLKEKLRFKTPSRIYLTNSYISNKTNINILPLLLKRKNQNP